MSVLNNAVLIRRELLTRVIKHLIAGTLEKDIDRIPLEMRPRKGEPVRCCVYKDRAVIKYKLMAILGFNIIDETDELTPLSEYVRMAAARENVSSDILTVVDEACSSCRKTSYQVSNMCRGCVARPCVNNCPKNAISVYDGKAHIDNNICVNCGKCQQVCPFHAVVYVPVPCEEICPVGAISKNADGVEEIDRGKCIFCGKCMNACPFGAVMEKSHLVNIFREKRGGRETVALLAPAIYGQFGTDPGRIIQGFKMLGFDHVYEIASGAETTARHEATELEERVARGDSFMTTSCCPAYTTLVEKHIPALKPFVSDTATPMHYTALEARKMHPDGCIVVVAPCSAKRYEALNDSLADYTLSFEEYGAWLVASGIDLKTIVPAEIRSAPQPWARGFALSGGVTDAILAVNSEVVTGSRQINGIDKSAVRLLKSLPGNCDVNFVEVMTCEGGCIGGCNAVSNPKIAARELQKLFAENRQAEEPLLVECTGERK